MSKGNIPASFTCKPSLDWCKSYKRLLHFFKNDCIGEFGA